MAAFHGHRVKDRSAKLEKKRKAVVKNGRPGYIAPRLYDVRVTKPKKP